MNNPNLTLLEVAVRLLEPLLDDLVFAGGCATGLLISDPAAEGVRPTTDVDAITEVSSYSQYTTLSERLRMPRDVGRRAGRGCGRGYA